MDMKYKLPFKAGHLVESRSFLSGYRGSWFRCKVREISWKKQKIGCILEYIDFPDEKKRWSVLYQKPPIAKAKGMKDVQRELMVRPCYPPIFQEDQINDSRTNLEVAVIVNNDWKVGDLVDWWTDNIYWSGEVIQLLDHDKAKLKLPDPPVGEGMTYDVELKDIRPTLHWSPVQGWTLPANQVDGNRRYCCRLMQPTIQGEHPTLQAQKDSIMSTSAHTASLSSHASPSLSPSHHTSEQHPAVPLQKQKIVKYDVMEASNEKHGSVKLDNFATTRPDQLDTIKADDRPPKRKKVSSCNDAADTIEASVLELEELACKIQWLKMVLNHGSLPLNTRPSWKFENNRVTSAPKSDSTTNMKEMKIQGAQETLTIRMKRQD